MSICPFNPLGRLTTTDPEGRSLWVRWAASIVNQRHAQIKKSKNSDIIALDRLVFRGQQCRSDQ
jgi:hypothetical protein